MKTWARPQCTEIKMDAEIGSYQDDDDRGREPPDTFFASDAVASVGGPLPSHAAG
jgi:hypothetical protein